MRERIEAVMNSILITTSVKRMQEKVEGTVERPILSGALTKQSVYDLSFAAQEREKRKDKDNIKVIQKYGEIYIYIFVGIILTALAT